MTALTSCQGDSINEYCTQVAMRQSASAVSSCLDLIERGGNSSIPDQSTRELRMTSKDLDCARKPPSTIWTSSLELNSIRHCKTLRLVGNRAADHLVETRKNIRYNWNSSPFEVALPRGFVNSVLKVRSKMPIFSICSRLTPMK